MKKIVQIFFVSFLGTVLLWSCKKDEDRVVFTGGTRPILTANVTTGDTILLAETDSLGTAVIFSWTNPNYQFSNGPSSYAVSYDIQIDTLGANFSDATTAGKGVITISPALGDSVLVKDFNNTLASASQLGLTPGKTYTIQVRVKAYYSNPGFTPAGGALPLYSDTLTYVVTPYKTTYPTLWVPGQYQSWTPATAPNLALSPFNPTSYEGYIYVPIIQGTGDNYDFKLTSLPSFSGTNYGLSSETGDSLSGGGALSTSGGAGNLSFGNYDTALTGADYAGYYLVTANISALTWTYQRTVWSVIGSFAASNWSSDIPMTYDPVRQELYSVITFATNDQFKFRANGNYTINLGLNASNNLAYNGSTNITVPTAGVDTVFLNLLPGNYSYSVVPQ
jgi:hypothetical protein